MYIWILLATIMVALSFFNLSPRSDVGNAVNEVKAATVVNRFRAEHIAMVRTVECEVIKNHFGSGDLYPTNTTFNLDVFKTGVKNLAYTQYKCNLPFGYEREGGALNNVHHALACTTKRLEDHEGDNEVIDCGHTSHRYLVSYVKVPDRWLSKDSSGDSFQKPLPALVGLVAKSTGAGTVYGWLDCYEKEGSKQCHLYGYSAKIGMLTDDEISGGEGGEAIKKLIYTRIDPKAPIWTKMEHFNECFSQPCLFAYEKLPTYDKGLHCKTLMDPVKAEQNKECEFLGYRFSD